MQSDILVIGGKGKTGGRVARALARMGVALRIATRNPQGVDEVAFDWMRPDLSRRAFAGARAIYIVAPTDTTDHGPVMLPLLEDAMVQGVRRFVLLSASLLEAGGPMMGQVHAWLMANAPEWTVLRPSWFMQNFSEQQHLPTIRDEGAIYSATGAGRVGFIDANDIADAAVAALTCDRAWNRDFILTGSETLSYGDVAAHIGTALGRPVRHVDLSVEALADRFRKSGMDADYAAMLAALDEQIAGGSEDRVTDGVRQLTGRDPAGFAAFVTRDISCWQS